MLQALPREYAVALVSVTEKKTIRAYGVRRSMKIDFRDVDEAPMTELNEILWNSIKGADSPVPVPVHHVRSAGRQPRGRPVPTHLALRSGIPPPIERYFASIRRTRLTRRRVTEDSRTVSGYSSNLGAWFIKMVSNPPNATGGIR